VQVNLLEDDLADNWINSQKQSMINPLEMVEGKHLHTEQKEPK
jgi:hypothetical protein